LQDDRQKEARILVIDDEPQNVRYITDVLNWAGYEHVEGVTDPLEAAQRFQDVDPDLVILDLLMPELDGFDVMEAIRGLQPDEAYLPILVLTSDISSESRRRALGGGAKDFLIKPMSPTELRLRVDNLLETRFLYLKCASLAQVRGTRARSGGGEQEVDTELQLLERWAASIDQAQPSESDHAKRVSWVSGRLAETLELPSHEVELIRRAALLHDLESGQRVLEGSALPVLERAREMLSGLAESWDGSGTSGLRGPAIPLIARIVSVADHFDRLTHGNSSPSGHDDPLVEIERLAGQRFDPTVVQALLQTQSVRTV
jgi:putative two-component system response regulator